MSDTKTELELLKERATKLGIDFHPNTGTDKLKKLIEAALSETEGSNGSAGTEDSSTLTKAQRRLELKKDAEKLVRVRVSCMNPNKKGWEGEIFSVGNSAIGQVRKFVLFDTEDGYHIPNIIYKMLIDRKCQTFGTRKDEKGNKVRYSKEIKEFAVEVLKPLTEAELKDLAQRQAMANGTN